jgi:4-alpha-glucanotransferase
LGDAIAPPLAELCRRVGIDLGFWDVRGAWTDARPEALCAILRARGHAVEHQGQAAAALAAHDRASWATLVPPVAVAHGDGGAAVGLRVAAAATGPVVISLRREDGHEIERTARLEDLPVSFTAESDGIAVVERRLVLDALPVGYHRARIAAAGRRGETLILQAPERCHAPPGALRGFGLFAPLYGLGGERRSTVGDLGDLAALARLTHEHGGELVGTLPLLACYYDQPFEPSPYSPVTRQFWNELYLDIPALAAHLGGRAADPLVVPGREPLPRAVDYREAYAGRRAVLEDLAAQAWGREAVRAELETELRQRPQLDDYARFRATVETLRTHPGAWSAAARAGDLGAVDETRRRYHVFVQWALHRGLAAIKAAAERGDTAGLYLDLPVGCHSDGYDLWRERATFAPGIDVGAPPDPLAWQGQNWALPPLEPEALRRSGYRYLIDCLRAHAGSASMLRIDHVMGLHRLFWIPHDMPAAHGVYVRYPAEELWAVVALESVRGRCAIVGEDLGTVPEELRPLMGRRGVHRLYVAQFEWDRGEDGGARLRPAPAGSVAGLDTHDTRTFARFVEQEGLGDPAALLVPWLEALGESDADLVLVALEDLWLELEPQNVPGTMDHERPNWRQRLARPAAEALADPAIVAALKALVQRRKTTGAGGGSHATLG